MNTDPIKKFYDERQKTIRTYKDSQEWNALSNQWMQYAFMQRYMYNYDCMGRPIIQTPVDMVATQELIWDVKPDLIIETGIAHGGSLILSASCLALLDYCDALAEGRMLDPQKPARKVIGIDIDIRDHNRAAIEAHPMANRIELVQGSSVAPETVAEVKKHSEQAKRIMVFLDSNHTHDHVIQELRLYAPLTSKDSYCVVFDTLVEDLPASTFPDRPWAPGNNPKTAVHAYLKELEQNKVTGADNAPLNFEIDHDRIDKLLITVAPDGYLKRV